MEAHKYPIAMSAPSLAYANAIALPIPLSAPVMRATWEDASILAQRVCWSV